MGSAKIDGEIVKVLEICRDIELTSAELYEYFAKIFSDHEEMAALWDKTAQEEENHAKQFILAISMRRDQIVDALFIDSSTAENTLSFVKAIYDVVRVNKPSMLEALSSAITLEVNLSKFHMTTAVHFVEKSQRQLFAAMMKADKNHIEALREFHQRLLIA